VITYLILLGIVLAITGDRRDLLALRRPRSWGTALGLAVVVVVAIEILDRALDPLLHGAREQGLTPSHWEPNHAAAYVANGIVLATIVPFVEELVFRGLGYSLLERYGRWLAIVLVGLTFAAGHGLVQAFPELAVFGGALAWLRSRTNSVYPGMLIHGTFNALAVIFAVAV